MKIKRGEKTKKCEIKLVN